MAGLCRPQAPFGQLGIMGIRVGIQGYRLSLDKPFSYRVEHRLQTSDCSAFLPLLDNPRIATGLPKLLDRFWDSEPPYPSFS